MSSLFSILMRLQCLKYGIFYRYRFLNYFFNIHFSYFISQLPCRFIREFSEMSRFLAILMTLQWHLKIYKKADEEQENCLIFHLVVGFFNYCRQQFELPVVTQLKLTSKKYVPQKWMPQILAQQQSCVTINQKCRRVSKMRDTETYIMPQFSTASN